MRVEPITIRSADVKDRIRKAAESNPSWKATWFVTKSFKYGTTIARARNQFVRWVSDVAKQTGAHICPISSIHRDDKGRVHIHAALCLDRRIFYRSVHNTWRCGYSWDKRYETGKGGINYILTDHQYIPLEKPFCPRKTKCRGKNGCKAQKNDDWKSLRIGGIGLPSSPVEAAPRNIIKRQTPFKKAKPNLINTTNRTSPVRIRRINRKEV